MHRRESRDWFNLSEIKVRDTHALKVEVDLCSWICLRDYAEQSYADMLSGV